MRLATALLLALPAAACTSAVEPVETTAPASVTTTSTVTTTEGTIEWDPIPASGLTEVELVSSIALGPLLDSVRPTAVVQHGLDGGGDEPSSNRPPARFFDGDDEDVVVSLVAAGESETLNPAGAVFAFQVTDVLLLEPTYDKISNSPERLSWNVMQRGLAGGPGGQWKLSLVNESDGSVNAQCVVRDQDNRFIRVNSSTELQPNSPATISCIFDDATNELRVEVDGVPEGSTDVVRQARDGTEQVVDDAFGDVNPNGGASCAGVLQTGIGNVITVGNKPACGATLTDDDRFQGEIGFAHIWRGTR